MKRLLIGATAVAAAIALPAAANAYAGRVTTSLNLRACASTACAPIAVLPPGAAVNVIGSAGNGWDYVTYANVTGYASANYIAAGYYPPPRPPVVNPIVVRPPVVRAYPVYPVYPVRPVYPVYPVYPRPRVYYGRPTFWFGLGF